jgi:hypothetical protein
MPSVFLRPTGNLYQVIAGTLGNEVSASAVPASVWTDNNDATYVESWNVPGDSTHAPYVCILEHLSGVPVVTKVVFHLRVSVNDSNSTSTFHVGMLGWERSLFTNWFDHSSVFITSPAVPEYPMDGTVYDYVVASNDYDPTIGADVATKLGNDVLFGVNFVGPIDSNMIRIHEVALEVFYLSATLNPLQRWPDGIATGPSRQWPRRVTRRPGTY